MLSLEGVQSGDDAASHVLTRGLLNAGQDPGTLHKHRVGVRPSDVDSDPHFVNLPSDFRLVLRPPPRPALGLEWQSRPSRVRDPAGPPRCTGRTRAPETSR